MSWVPIALLAVPLAGAAALLAPLPADAAARGRLLRLHGLTVSGITFLLAVMLAAGFDHTDPARVQFTTDLAWIPGLDLRFHLGVDGISLPLVVLTALLTFLCFVYLCWGRSDGPGQLLRPRPGGNRPRALVFTLLVLEVGMIGTFLALDLLLFFVFFEIVLIPMYFVIAVWGAAGARRRPSSSSTRCSARSCSSSACCSSGRRPALWTWSPSPGRRAPGCPGPCRSSPSWRSAPG